jgi:hypothetical protein
MKSYTGNRVKIVLFLLLITILGCIRNLSGNGHPPPSPTNGNYGNLEDCC